MPSTLDNLEKNKALFNRVANFVRKQDTHKDSIHLERNSMILDLYKDYLYLKNKDKVVDIEKIKQDFIENIVKDNDKMDGFLSKKVNSSDLGYFWGVRPVNILISRLLKRYKQNLDIVFVETGFIFSILNDIGHGWDNERIEYLNFSSVIVDDLTCYYDATCPSRIEMTLSSDFELTDEQKERARKNIQKIIKNKLTKYNHQPIFTPEIGREGVKKVLVIDQSYGDYSIIKGMADENTFKNMLDAAIKENPDADIIIKTHPDVIGKNTRRPRCYYQNIESSGNLYRLTEPINPISLIEYADKVYVCSSQFGFEALMCGKEVHTFGGAFYAGWGLTKDRLNFPRRTRNRTVEDIFYIAYIMFSLYLDYNKQGQCEIEDTIDNLLKLREQYFKEQV